MTKPRRHVTLMITGKVQGVFFRVGTLRLAKKYKVTGQVQNNPDGTVTVEAEGSEKAIKKLEAWCRRGPLNSRIDSCEITRGDLKEYSEFNIVDNHKS